MQVFFQLKKRPEPVVPNLGGITLSLLESDPALPFTIKQLNNLPENIKKRVYRNLLPPALLVKFNIDPVKWTGSDKQQLVFLQAEAGTEKVFISARTLPSQDDEFFALELADNTLNGIDLNLILLNDPSSARFGTDKDSNGNPTLFGTINRNVEEEAKAKAAGLAPGQIRNSFSASQVVLSQIESFLCAIGQRAFFLEPLSYASAWVFEKRGLAYVRGHKLMDDIHREFQPGGVLNKALDGSSPFRQPDQWSTIRGRAWAIHDGILNTMDQSWDKLRMVKQIGKHSNVSTAPSVNY